MTNDVLTYLKSLQNDLEEIFNELENTINDNGLDENLAEELENNVVAQLGTVLESLTEILESVERIDDVDYFNDPYNEGVDS
jgi:hypothetical protein